MSENEYKVLMAIIMFIGFSITFLFNHESRHDKFIRRDWPTYNNKPKTLLILPKHIRNRFGLPKKHVDLVTYLHYTTRYYGSIGYGLMIIPCLLLDIKTFGIVFLVFALIFFLAELPEAALIWRARLMDKFKKTDKNNSARK